MTPTALREIVTGEDQGFDERVAAVFQRIEPLIDLWEECRTLVAANQNPTRAMAELVAELEDS